PSRLPVDREPATTCAPSPASAMATARPMPLPAPVTTATLPSRSRSNRRLPSGICLPPGPAVLLHQELAVPVAAGCSAEIGRGSTPRSGGRGDRDRPGRRFRGVLGVVGTSGYRLGPRRRWSAGSVHGL